MLCKQIICFPFFFSNSENNENLITVVSGIIQSENILITFHLVILLFFSLNLRRRVESDMVN